MARRDSFLPRKKPTQERARATQEAIIDATARILGEEGIDAATTNRIAERAGVSVGSLYQYFPSKDSIIIALAERHFRKMLALLEAKSEELEGLPIEEAVPIYVRAKLAAHRIEPGLHRALFDQVPRLLGREGLKLWSERSS